MRTSQKGKSIQKTQLGTWVRVPRLTTDEVSDVKGKNKPRWG